MRASSSSLGSVGTSSTRRCGSLARRATPSGSMSSVTRTRNGMGWSAAVIAELDEETAVLHDVDPRRRQAGGEGVVANAELQPDGARTLGEDVVEVRGQILRTAEHVHHVDVTGNRGEAAVHLLSENLRDLGIVYRH